MPRMLEMRPKIMEMRGGPTPHERFAKTGMSRVQISNRALSSRLAVVTGAANEIGLAIAHELAAEGAESVRWRPVRCGPLRSSG